MSEYREDPDSFEDMAKGFATSQVKKAFDPSTSQGLAARLGQAASGALYWTGGGVAGGLKDTYDAVASPVSGFAKGLGYNSDPSTPGPESPAQGGPQLPSASNQNAKPANAATRQNVKPENPATRLAQSLYEKTAASMDAAREVGDKSNDMIRGNFLGTPATDYSWRKDMRVSAPGETLTPNPEEPSFGKYANVGTDPKGYAMNYGKGDAQLEAYKDAINQQRLDNLGAAQSAALANRLAVESALHGNRSQTLQRALQSQAEGAKFFQAANANIADPAKLGYENSLAGRLASQKAAYDPKMQEQLYMQNLYKKASSGDPSATAELEAMNPLKIKETRDGATGNVTSLEVSGKGAAEHYNKEKSTSFKSDDKTRAISLSNINNAIQQFKASGSKDVSQVHALVEAELAKHVGSKEFREGLDKLLASHGIAPR